jgi:hypothetical protein
MWWRLLLTATLECFSSIVVSTHGVNRHAAICQRKSTGKSSTAAPPMSMSSASWKALPGRINFHVGRW